MFSGINKKALEAAMKQMGVKQQALEAESVVIRLRDKELVFISPEVMMISMGGQESFQVVGRFSERPRLRSYEPSEEDVALVVEQTGASKEAAIKALEDHKGDIAAVILDLKEGK
ncbi:nascent polypeptide-associated complex protein [Candidatus Woesearchaeota archaeon CG08_land_8_20_14_0_20_47_9]|nr:MAG: nascent polypeptide-associated complex protein [Candidatus Woesearchaeota archaeon CG08_land_8_20_14_0_20_47_9]HII29604.1 nascent polypeptide-associated complex protein [Candidatus Woesearchaeota archaeon]